MSFLARNPMDPNQQQQPMGRQIQGAPTLNTGPGPLSTIGMMAAPKVADAAFTAGTNALASQGAGLMNTVGTALGGTAAAGSAGAGLASAAGAGAAGAAGAGAAAAGAGAAGAGLAGALGAAAPMLAAAGPFALMALPFLLKDGTRKVPGGYNNGTMGVPDMDYGPDPFPQGYNNGTMGVKPTTNMAYADGVDSVPAMLTPGEAVIPAPAAQNPANKPMIDSMINEGRAANDMADNFYPPYLEGQPSQYRIPAPVEIETSVLAGPLSGKAQREQMKLLQDMSLKKKSWEAEEARKQKAFEEKMSQGRMKSMMSLQQSQE